MKQALLGLGFIVTSLMLTAAYGAPAKNRFPFPVIDAHVHLGFGEPDSEDEEELTFPYTKQEFLKQAAEAGIKAFVAHTHDIRSITPVMEGLTPIYCAGIRDSTDLEPIRKGLQTGKYRCLKVYLAYVPRWAYDSFYEPFYKLAAEFHVPVVFHTGDTSTSQAIVKYADPLTIDEVAVAHRGVTFVIAHAGNPWFQSAAEVAYKNPNVYMDASGIVIGDLSRNSQSSLEKLLITPINWVFTYIENPKKMMFGTDWPLVHIKPYMDLLAQAIPAAYHRAFFYENAARVFKIDLPAPELKPVKLRAPASKK